MDPLKDLYYIDAAHAALVDAENYACQGRKAKAQDSLLTARYFAAKCEPTDLVQNFDERVKAVYKKTF